MNTPDDRTVGRSNQNQARGDEQTEHETSSSTIRATGNRDTVSGLSNPKASKKRSPRQHRVVSSARRFLTAARSPATVRRNGKNQRSPLVVAHEPAEAVTPTGDPAVDTNQSQQDEEISQTSSPKTTINPKEMVLVLTIGDTCTSNDDARIDANSLESMKAPVSDRPLPPKQSGPINGSITLKHVQPHAGFAYIVATEEQGDDNASDSECMRMMKEVFSIYTLGLTTSKELHDR